MVRVAFLDGTQVVTRRDVRETSFVARKTAKLL